LTITFNLLVAIRSNNWYQNQYQEFDF